SPERDILRKYKSEKESSETQNSLINSLINSRYLYFSLFVIVIYILYILDIGSFILLLKKNEVTAQKQTQSINNPTLLLSESIKNIKETFSNQESYIWNDISSAINEVKSRTPKVPSIILLFAKETTTMDCLATKLAEMSRDILHADEYLTFKPENVGNDAGEIINELNKLPLEKKKVVMIKDILNINTEAIKDLHNLCDRHNPLVAEDRK
ncbi:PREDICTED: uncharacterized protein LOC105461285, partial [Wasmannia auropunctata]|uniref:uncharacterized protein LOC105461285 n=1 Tax=Wasmannia auropunctata TaxID=64793 RepID=UPI0005F0260E